MGRWLGLLLLLAAHAAAGGAAVALYLDGTVDGTAASLARSALAEAERLGVPLVVVLDTYGGFLGPMDQIVEMFLNAGVPVYAYVPEGAKAVSAGAFIAMAAKRIYMAPTAEIGAAEPRPPDPKVVNYAAARMRSLASAKWNDSRVDVAESFVRQNRVLTGAEAVKLGIAEPPPPEGWSFAAVYRRDPLARLLNALSDPALISLMILLGVVLIGYELVAAGFQGVGVVGGVLLALALYLVGQLGADLLSLLLALAGAALIVGEMVAGHGALAASGLALFALSLYFAGSGQPYYQSQGASYAAAGLAAVGAVAVAYVGYKVRQALKRRPLDYRSQLMGARGVAKTEIGPGRPGVVYVAGEEWTAVSDEAVERGAEVVVVEVEGLTLKVKKVVK